MKILLRDYLASLKESKELDAIIPDLLCAMGWRVFLSAQIGIRQHGVDIGAVYDDTVYLFVVKAGNITRGAWSTNEQDLRPSLVDILDVFIPTCLPAEFNDKAIKVVTCCGGEIRGEVAQNLAGFEHQHQSERVTFERWEGSRLAASIEEHLLNANLIQNDFQSDLRRSLALICEDEYDLRHFRKLISDMSELAVRNDSQDIRKSFATHRLIASLTSTWAISENQARHALDIAELSLLCGWHRVVRNQLALGNHDRPPTQADVQIQHLVEVFLAAGRNYVSQVSEFADIEDGASAGQHFYAVHCLNVFDVIGRLAVIGQVALHWRVEDETLSANVKEVLKSLVSNNCCSAVPSMNNHIVDISLAIDFLVRCGELEFCSAWLRRICKNLFDSYRVKRFFPIQGDDIYDLARIEAGDKSLRDRQMKSSSLVTIVFEWCISLGVRDGCQVLREIQRLDHAPNFQLWFPDGEFDEVAYISGGIHTGICLSTITLPEAPQTNISQAYR
ncbi:MAG: hypothetical protein AAF483_19935, partial [Planctomycetota bacterium]